ncbi:MAG: PEP-CTERM sorting domain-containing protein [Armatimonadota bacterium]|nr:PEP-CTERM sorting domain-containing protein [Armatimonadota bacterium]
MQLHYVRTFMMLLVASAWTIGSPNGGHHQTERHPPGQHWQGVTRWDAGKGGGYGTDGSTLWYGGDFDGRAALHDERSNYQGTVAVYDNFLVTGGGWQVQAVFANLLFNYDSEGADFEIRSGVSEGNGGTVVFSGSGLAETQTATGRSWQGWTEYTVEIDSLNLFLTPGEYWLVVRSVTSGCGGGWYLSQAGTTLGANSIGKPIGDGNSYFKSGSYNFVQTGQFLGAGTWDFSFGVNGTVVPEPGTLVALASGIALLLLLRRRNT